MALKAGRVGVAVDQVDEFGKINSEATSGYTKQEADAKFETQSHAASTYETKSDAAALQPIQLSVPISMLDGSKLTVETALNGLNDLPANKKIAYLHMGTASFANPTTEGDTSVISVDLSSDPIPSDITNIVVIPINTGGNNHYIYAFTVYDIVNGVNSGFKIQAYNVTGNITAASRELKYIVFGIK